MMIYTGALSLIGSGLMMFQFGVVFDDIREYSEDLYSVKVGSRRVRKTVNKQNVAHVIEVLV